MPRPPPTVRTDLAPDFLFCRRNLHIGRNVIGRSPAGAGPPVLRPSATRGGLNGRLPPGRDPSIGGGPTRRRRRGGRAATEQVGQTPQEFVGGSPARRRYSSSSASSSGSGRARGG